eukprot:SAG11_NODE_2937_length_2824_cov_1.679633_3_plen_252_part_00
MAVRSLEVRPNAPPRLPPGGCPPPRPARRWHEEGSIVPAARPPPPHAAGHSGRVLGDAHCALRLRTAATPHRSEMWGMQWETHKGGAAEGKPESSPYMALYNASHHALKAVSPRLSIGGPATMELLYITEFVQAAAAWGVPVQPADFVSTHSCAPAAESCRPPAALTWRSCAVVDSPPPPPRPDPTDACNSMPDARQRLDCFTDGIIAARQQASGHTFLLTEFNCGCAEAFAPTQQLPLSGGGGTPVIRTI